MASTLWIPKVLAIFHKNVKYSTKNLKGGYTGNDFLVLHLYLNEKGPSANVQLLHSFTDHHTEVLLKWVMLNDHYLMLFG